MLKERSQERSPLSEAQGQGGACGAILAAIEDWTLLQHHLEINILNGDSQLIFYFGISADRRYATIDKSTSGSWAGSGPRMSDTVPEVQAAVSTHSLRSPHNDYHR